MIKKCVICGKEFKTYRKTVNITCSIECRTIQHKKDMTGRCGEKASNWKQGKTKIEGRKYIYKKGHKNATVNKIYIAEHRLIMSEKLGRPLKRTEVVHHINGDYLDNRIENLIIVTRSEHNKIHNFCPSKYKNKI